MQRHHGQDDHFRQFMFGGRRSGTRAKHHRNHHKNQSSIDIEGLLENFGTLKESAQNLKPLVEMAYPFIEMLWKKK